MSVSVGNPFNNVVWRLKNNLSLPTSTSSGCTFTLPAGITLQPQSHSILDQLQERCHHYSLRSKHK